MINIATVHYKQNKWVEIHNKYLKAFIDHPYRIWSFCKDITMDIINSYKVFSDGVEDKKDISKDHWIKLNYVTNKLYTSDAKDDEIILWIDSDAFPIKPCYSFIKDKLSEYPFGAINRKENFDLFPHPSFAFSTLGFARKHNLSWEAVLNDEKALDTGGKIYRYFEKENIPWYRMNRTKSLTDHPVMYTIYDDLVYHHCAGSRVIRNTRWDNKTELKVEHDEAEIFNKIKDLNFWNGT